MIQSLCSQPTADKPANIGRCYIQPGTRLPSQPQSFTTLWPVPILLLDDKISQCEQLARGRCVVMTQSWVERATYTVWYSTTPIWIESNNKLRCAIQIDSSRNLSRWSRSTKTWPFLGTWMQQQTGLPRICPSPKTLPVKMPMVINSWFAVPNIPRRLYGDISVRYSGASCVAMPTMTSTNWLLVSFSSSLYTRS